MALTSEEIAAKQEKEKTFLFYKTVKCPICDNDSKWRTIKSGKLRVDGTDRDMRQLYYGVDANKYHIISCPHCGYTALERFFTSPLPSVIVKQIKEGLVNMTKLTDGDPELITYRQAFSRCHMALQCASLKGAASKASELGYICLKTAWLLRGEREELIELGQQEKGDALIPVEKRFLKNAYDQLTKAMMTESFPLAGMDEPTVDYIVGALAMDQGDYSSASKLLSSVVTSFAANGRLKDKARELREELSQLKQASES